MGINRMGPPSDLVLDLSKSFQIDTFIETGTYKGETSAWASRYFPSVITVENSAEIYSRAKDAHRDLRNIRFINGDTRHVLRDLINGLALPALFWLDAHWSGGVTYGANDECPILEELHIINASPHNHYILIDDARLFLSPPPPPHQIEQWPSISALLGELNKRDRYIVIFEDVIIAVPRDATDIVARYSRTVSSSGANGYAHSLLQRIKNIVRM